MKTTYLTLLSTFAIAASSALVGCGSETGELGPAEMDIEAMDFEGNDHIGEASGDEAAAESVPEAPETEFGTKQEALFGSDACKNTEIVVTNNRIRSGLQTDIKVTKFKYYNSSEGKWQTEGVTNQEVSYSTTHWFWNQDLEHAENDLITSWRIYYKYELSGGGWSSEVYQTNNTVDARCSADDNFYLSVN